MQELSYEAFASDGSIQRMLCPVSTCWHPMPACCHIIKDIVVGIFLLRLIRRSIHTTSKSICLKYMCKITNTTQTIDRDTIFLGEKFKSGKITGRRRKIHYNLLVYMNYRHVLVFFKLGLDGRPKGVSFSLEKKSLFVLNSPPSGGWGVSEICVAARSSYTDLL